MSGDDSYPWTPTVLCKECGYEDYHDPFCATLSDAHLYYMDYDARMDEEQHIEEMKRLRDEDEFDLQVYAAEQHQQCWWIPVTADFGRTIEAQLGDDSVKGDEWGLEAVLDADEIDDFKDDHPGYFKERREGKEGKSEEEVGGKERGREVEGRKEEEEVEFSAEEYLRRDMVEVIDLTLDDD